MGHAELAFIREAEELPPTYHFAREEAAEKAIKKSQVSLPGGKYH